MSVHEVPAWKPTHVSLWFGLATSLESFPSTEKTQNPKSPFWVSLSLESHQLAASSLPAAAASVVPSLGHVLPAQALEIPSSNPCWGSLTWQGYGAVDPSQPPPDQSIGKIIPDCTSLCRANSNHQPHSVTVPAHLSTFLISLPLHTQAHWNLSLGLLFLFLIVSPFPPAPLLPTSNVKFMTPE